MPYIVTMATVTAGAEDGAIASWKVSVGERIAKGQVIAEVETEKALVDLLADAGGTVAHLAVEVGRSVPVGTPIAVVGLDGDSAEAVRIAIGSTESAGSTPVVGDPGRGSSPIADAPRVPRRVPSSPLARAVARSSGVDVRSIRGTGPGGRVMRADVESAMRTQTARVGPAHEGQRGELLPVSRMRAAIARRLTEAKQTIPHFYLQSTIDAGRLLDLRKALNAHDQPRISVNDLIVRAASLALQRVPGMNRAYSSDGVLQFESSDVGVAVALEDGLVVPVLHDAQRLDVRALATELRSLVLKARSGALRQHELAGGALTVSNLGMFGVESFCAIINPPHAGILAVGAVKEGVVVKNGAIRAGVRMVLTLSADHRILDGAIAAEWLSDLTLLLENPIELVR